MNINGYKADRLGQIDPMGFVTYPVYYLDLTYSICLMQLINILFENMQLSWE